MTDITQLQTRSATHEDAVRIAALLGQLGYDSSPESIVSRLARRQEVGERHEVIVAEMDGKVAGVAAMSLEFRLGSDETKVHMTEIVVDEAARGKGVGRALIERASEWGKTRGADLLFVLTNQQRPFAHAFYRSLGFLETHRTFKLPLT